MTLRQKILRRLVNFYPPFMGAGIKIRFSKDNRRIFVSMPLKWFNRNYVNVHFGGSLYMMCDPFFMLLLMDALGDDYIVWDKSAAIEFVKPGKSTVFAEFYINNQKIEEIRRELEHRDKIYPEFLVNVIDKDGQVIAKVRKVIYVRKKNRA
ncbi:MAG: DUF4442 domain-containing protein [Deltaproteobacteria bacterium]|nr:DUF4442 domain-containing protein [Deltaproteobacteria bacterium]